jgi:hypothetical protein
MANTYETLNMALLSTIIENEGYNGGIIDFGNFTEGFCFKLNTLYKQTYILCADSLEEKLRIMENIKQMKITQQRSMGIIALMNLSPTKTASLTDALYGHTKDPQDVNKNESADGYWVLLQDWSQCTVKCGGGESVYQRLCVPPKNGGNPCKGEAIVRRPCNTHPCPSINGDTPIDPIFNSNTTFAKPIVKVMPYSSRPTRYSKCIIKESDMMMLKDVEGNAFQKDNREQLPIRLIMNNRTISAFENDNIKAQVVSFNLHSTDFRRSKYRKYCFVLSEGNQKSEFCPFAFEKEKRVYEEWDSQFHLFKYSCETEPDIRRIILDANLKKEFVEKIVNIIIKFLI